MELNFDNIFKPTVFAMRTNRSHPSVIRDLKWILQFITTHGVFTLIFYFLLYNIQNDLKRNDFSATCRNGCLCVVYIVITFQYCIMLYYQKILMKLINMMENDFETYKNLTGSELVAYYAKKGRWVCQQWVVISVVGFIIFPFKNIVLYVVYYYRKYDFELIPLYDLTYPPIIEENKNNIFVYIIIYMLLVFYAGYSAFMYTAFVPLGPMFMLHACGQMELVKKRIDNLFEGPSDGIEVELRSIIQQLQCVYSFVEDVKKCFRVVYELTLKATVVILPITCYEVIESFHTGEASLEFLTFIVGGTLITSSPCYYSDLLIEKGDQVRLAIYTCGWERKYDRSTRRTLLLVMLRGSRPVAIRTVFRTVCLDALAEVFKQSYAIFNLMNAAWKK